MSLYRSNDLHFDIDSQLDAKLKIQNFIESVTGSLSDEIFDAVEKFQKRTSMVALKHEVERLTRVNREDKMAIMGNHLEDEFERRLLD